MSKIKEELKRHNITALEVEEMSRVISDLLKAYAEDVKEDTPYAFNEISNAEKAAETVNELGCNILMEYDEEDGCNEDEEDPDDLDDDSNLGCKDCPEDECTGHCMSCYYRS